MEENNDDDNKDELTGDEEACRTSSRVQFAEDLGKMNATDASTPAKDALLLQPCTSDDGYLTPTARTTTDSAGVDYLNVLDDSPTDTMAARKRVLILLFNFLFFLFCSSCYCFHILHLYMELMTRVGRSGQPRG